MARTRDAAQRKPEPVNPEGFTWREWHMAAGTWCKIQNSKQKLLDAWQAGEDPCDWRAAAEAQERAARAMVRS